MKASKIIKFLTIAFINSIIVLILGGFLMLKPINMMPTYVPQSGTTAGEPGNVVNAHEIGMTR